MTSGPARVGIIGAGTISGIYLENSKKFDAFDIVAIGDLRVDGAQKRADEYGIAKACSVEELLADPEIDVVINLTPHRVHGKVGIQILEAGKHPYNEKPLSVHREDGQKMLAIAKEKGLRVGGAPDTFFGGAWQTARALIDRGDIGEPIGAFANLHARPNPNRKRRLGGVAPDAGYTSFYATDYYAFGGGAIFDRGPYYLNALIHLLGPFQRVAGLSRATWPERQHGDSMLKVEVPTHATASLQYASGAICTFLQSNDVYDTGLPHIEIYGSEGSLRCIDPNNFGGDIFIRRPDSPELEAVPLEFGYLGNSRGVGVADFCRAIANDRPQRAHGEMAYHVVDVINSIIESSDRGEVITLESTCAQPAPLPTGLEDWTITD
ncbi:MAG: Gfo/Idh/MocA family oxidoreductase [Thermomicrobiales bacterium]